VLGQVEGAAVRLAPPPLTHGAVSIGVVRSPTPAGYTDLQADRTSVLGNWFKMGHNGRDERLRDAVCDAYEQVTNHNNYYHCTTPLNTSFS